MWRIGAVLPSFVGGFGLRSAHRAQLAAHWASWADALKMVQERHPGAVEIIWKPTASPIRSKQCGGAEEFWKVHGSRGHLGQNWLRDAHLVDSTMASPLHRDGSARRGAATNDREALTQAHRRKERTYPELVGDWSKAHLVVLAAEVEGGGPTLLLLAWAKVR